MVFIILLIVYALGVFSAIEAILRGKSAQGTTAWVLALLLIPFLSLPWYWLVGRSRFSAYTEVMAEYDQQAKEMPGSDSQAMGLPLFTALERLTGARSTSDNLVQLLVDGYDTFDEILAAIADAKISILVQFYSVSDDEIGGQLKDSLIEATGRGVAVHLLYDQVGSIGLGDEYIAELNDAGVKTACFSGARRWLIRFQFNFRNHRKIVLIDGKKGFTGGINVGDNYRSSPADQPGWRDTHLKIEGGALVNLYDSYRRDWFYADGDYLPDGPEVVAGPGSDAAIICGSGPAEALPVGSLVHNLLINSAKERLWLATPYFIPTDDVLAALQSAALRGLDVRVLIPRTTDHWMFRFAPYAFIRRVLNAGVGIYFYEPCFMHQKVLLIDDDVAVIGTANLDYRSLLLNFESTAIIASTSFNSDVESMLQADFDEATEVTSSVLDGRRWHHRLATALTRLLAPIL